MSDPDDVLAGGFSASAPAPAQDDDPLLTDLGLQDEVVTASLERALADTAELVAEVRERHADDHDPAPAARMQAVCEAADAPLELQSLLRRVSDGVITWDDVWREPGAHEGGMLCLARLVQSIDLAALGDRTDEPEGQV